MTSPPPQRLTELLQHTAWLRRLARHLVSDVQTADDVVQMTFMAALEHEEAPRSGLQQWLGGVARKIALQMRRADGRREWREERAARAESLFSAEEMTARVEIQQLLSKAVLDLPEPYRSTVFLRYFEDLTPAEIAARQNLPASTVRVRLKRGLDQLRERLDRSFGGDTQAWGLALLPLAAATRVEVPAASTGALASLFTGTTAMSIQWKVTLTTAAILGISAALWPQRAEGPPLDPDSQAALDASLAAPDLAQGSSLAHPTPALSRSNVAIGDPIEPNLEPVTTEEGYIVGRVLDELQRPIAGARIVGVESRPHDARILDPLAVAGAPAETLSDEFGRYRLEAAAAWAFTLGVTHPGFAPSVERGLFAGEQHDVILILGATLTVSVFDAEDGRALSGISVGATSLGADLKGAAKWSISTTTDDDGTARLSHIPQCAFLAHASAPGCAAAHWRLTADGEPHITHTFRLEREVAVRGVVVDAVTGAPVAGARVESGGKSTTSDREGQFRLGRFRQVDGSSPTPFLATAPGYSPGLIYVSSFVSGQVTDIVLNLGPAPHVRGRVVDERQVPISGATVVFRGRFSTMAFTAEGHDGRTVTDAYGHFGLPSIHPDGRYDVAAAAPGLAKCTTSFASVGEGGELDLGDLVLAPGGSISGTVASNFDEFHADYVVVGLRVDGASRVPIASVPVTSQGAFRLENLAPGQYDVELRVWRTTPTRRADDLLGRRHITLASGEERGNVSLEQRAAIRGSVVGPGGRPVRSARVSLYRGARDPALEVVTVDRKGAFEFQVDGVGPYLVRAWDPALLLDPDDREGVAAGAAPFELRLRSRSTGHAIRGRVTDGEGVPLPHIYIRLTNTATGVAIARVGLLDEWGAFEVNNLDDVAYDLATIDVSDRFEPGSKAGVRPGGKAVEFQLVRRR